MATVNLRGLRKSYGAIEVIKGVDLDVDDREFVVFVGPSGCGKSTLLRMIAGLEKISGGDLLIDGKRSNDIAPAKRGLAMVFQSYALYPHMTIAENMGFALRIEGVPRTERAGKVQAAAEVLQLGPLLQRRPKELSGGQRQRVAIGRAIVRNPKVFLFDEPLSNLDAALRVQMRIELMRLHEQLQATMIYVTHDQVEAMTMADKIVVLNSGRIEQVGAPLDLYNHPRNLFVAGFIGSPRMNMLAAEIVAIDPAGLTLSLPGRRRITMPVAARDLKVGAKVTFGIRPEHVLPLPRGEDGGDVLSGEVSIVEHLGGLTIFHTAIADDETVVVQTDGKSPVRAHTTIHMKIDLSSAHVFGPDGMALTKLTAAAATA